MAEDPKKNGKKSRLEEFTWFSKQELYEYFQGMYHITREEVDREIDEALKSFQLRKGQPIDPKELWQKVGGTIEHKLSRRNEATALYRIDKKIIKDHQNNKKKK